MAAQWQESLLSSGWLEPGARRRTVRDWVVDVVMFAAAVISGILALASTWEQHSIPTAVADIALGAVACGALFVRRAHPLAVALLVITLSAVSALAAFAPLPAVFNAAIRLRLRELVGVAALSVTATAVLPLLYPQIEDRGYGWQVVVGLLLTAVALGWGLFVRAQRGLFRELRTRAEERAREVERRRIAREMHDVLAHRLTILSVHAGAFENAGDRVPREYAEAAQVIRASARTALDELRQVIGLLREPGPDAGPEPPQPTVGEIPALVAESTSAGLSIRYREELDATIPDLIGRTAYRVVQEGLTNARKHAGDGPVDVVLRAGPPLVVEVVSREAAASGLPGSGIGLVGLAERVEQAGGEFASGPDASGNFVLKATLPW